MRKITDSYGNNIGSVDKKNDDYIIRDKQGMRTGSAEKKFMPTEAR